MVIGQSVAWLWERRGSDSGASGTYSQVGLAYVLESGGREHVGELACFDELGDVSREAQSMHDVGNEFRRWSTVSWEIDPA